MEEWETLFTRARNDCYILDEHNEPVAVDYQTWSEWYRDADRTVARAMFKTRHGDVLVSTVFLSLNHNSLGSPPILYETMVFADDTLLQELVKLSEHFATDHVEWAEIQERYHTRSEAEQRHKEIATFVEVSLYKVLKLLTPDAALIKNTTDAD